jgi:hypothetical protein
LIVLSEVEARCTTVEHPPFDYAQDERMFEWPY